MYRRLASDDGLVPLRARVRSEILDALHEEALTRRVPPGRLLAEMLAEFLPVAAADRVRRQIAPGRPLRVVSGDVSKSDDTPVCRDAPTDHGTPEKQGTQQPELLGASDDSSSRRPSMPSIGASGRLMASTAHTKPDANGTSD